MLFMSLRWRLVGPGQQLGAALARIPGRIDAYTVNIGGSIAGILLFTMLMVAAGTDVVVRRRPCGNRSISRDAPSLCRWRSSR